jgi:hypothetical protein
MNNLVAHPHLRAGTALAVAALVVLLCSPAQAGQTGHRHPRPRHAATAPARVATPPAVQPLAAPVGSAGMMIAIDPQTGALVPPSAAQVLRLTSVERTGLSRSSEGLTEVRLADGTVMVDLQGRFMEYSVLRLDLQGRPHFSCMDDERALLHWLTSREPAPTTLCEEK